MKYYIIFCVSILILSIKNAIASGRQGYVPSYTITSPPIHVPITKNSKEIESILLSFPRKEITIDEIKSNEKFFFFTGTYKSQRELESFIEKINNYSESKRNIKLETHKVRFAGSDTLYFKISGDNQW